jgi:hypothetical protein
LFIASNIPRELQENIGQQIEPYSIMPLLDGEVSGSGTLVKIDGVCGILTAGHVVQNWEKSQPKYHPPKRLGIVPDRQAGALIEEPLEHFHTFVIEAGESEEAALATS